MMTSRLIGCASVVVLALISNLAFAAVGTVTHLSGVLTSQKADGSSKVLAVKSEVDEGDLLSTEAETYARIRFVDGGEVVLRPGSQLKVDKYAYNQAAPQSDNIVLSMFKGGLRAVTGLIGKRNKEKVNFQTATATIGIRGTHFGMLVCSNNACINIPTTSGNSPPDGLHVDVADGAVIMRNNAGSVVINTGQFGFAAGNNVAPVIVPANSGHPVTIPNSIRRNRGGGSDIGGGGDAQCGV